METKIKDDNNVTTQEVKTGKNGNPFKNNKGKNKGKGGSRNSGGQERTQVPAGKRCHKDYDSIDSNDINWWNKAKTLFERSTNVPFNKVAGGCYALPDPTTGNYSDNYFSMPCVMTIDYTPGIGVAVDFRSPVNRAFQQMYSAIYSKTTGILQFPVASLGQHVVAMQSIAQNIAMAKRLLELAYMWSPENVAFPRLFIEACGFDPDDVLNGMNDKEADLNLRIRDFNTLMVPAYLDVFARQYMLAHRVFADADAVAAQFFIFKPTCYYLYSDLGLPADDDPDQPFDGKAAVWCCLYPDSYSTNTMKFSDLMNIIDNQIEAVRYSRDFTIINGSLLRAFPESSFLKIDEARLGDGAIPKVDDVMSYQIHNAIAVGYPEFDGEAITPSGITVNLNRANSIRFTTERGDLVVTPTFADPIASFQYNNYNCGAILNSFETTIPTADWIMESTRLIPRMQPVVGSGLTMGSSTGTEVVNGYHIYYFSQDGGAGAVQTHKVAVPMVIVDDLSIPDTVHTINLLSKFHKCPRIPVCKVDPDTGTQEIQYTGDFMNWTTVDGPSLSGLHTAALLSVYNTDAEVSVRSGTR